MAEPADSSQWTDTGPATAGVGGVFVPEELSSDLIGRIICKAAVTNLARHWPMKRLTLKIPKISAGITADWVDAMAVKPKSKVEFGYKVLTAEKLAVIVPFEDQLLEDADRDVAGIVRSDITDAMAEAMDQTFLGYSATSPFADSVSGNTPAGHSVAYGTGVDLAADANTAMGAIEEHGYVPTGWVCHQRIKSYLRGLRDANNNPIFVPSLTSDAPDTLYGLPIYYTCNAQASGSPGTYELLVADWRHVFIGDKRSLEITRATEATVTLSGTAINLWERDMTAIRAVLRVAFGINENNALAKVTTIP